MCNKVSLSITAGNIKAFRFVWAGNTAPYRLNKHASKISAAFFGYFPTKNSKLSFTDHQAIYFYTGCPRRNGQNFGRVFLMLKYTDITQNTYVQISTVTEIMAREV